MQPSDSPAAWVGTPVPLALDLPRSERFSEPAARAFAERAARRTLHLCWVARGPTFPRTKNRGLPGYWLVLVHSCRGQPPRLGRRRLARTITVTSTIAFRVNGPLGFPGLCVSRPYPRGPSARLPTHPPPRYRDDGKTSCRPAGLSISRAGLTPARRDTEFQEFIIPSFRTSIAWSHHTLHAVEMRCRGGGGFRATKEECGAVRHSLSPS